MAVLRHTCIHVVTDSKGGGGSQSYVFFHACKAYSVNRALKILLYGRLSLPGNGFKTCLAATEFLEVDAHMAGRRNRPNLMHLPRLSAIQKVREEIPLEHCDLEYFSKYMSCMTCQSPGHLHLLIFSPSPILLVTITHFKHSCFLFLYTLATEQQLCCLHVVSCLPSHT